MIEGQRKCVRLEGIGSEMDRLGNVWLNGKQGEEIFSVEDMVT